ncbi:hypothetical protein ABID58_002308 [Bradyrhizobium sp. S3.2.6]|uniref:hypothetical protein n=1 Tax=Bradyrhizobium sp. S3.2.6 TaxID=3156428 RepID=UPI003393BE29
MTDYSSISTKYRAYNITPDTLAGIVAVVKKFTEGPATTTIYLDDDHEVKDHNLDALLADSFVKAQKIQRIKIESRKTLGPDLVHSISINFESDMLRVVQVTITGDRDRAILARRELDTLLHGAEYWYSFSLAPRSSFLPFFLSFLIPIVLISALSVFLTWLFGGEVTEKSTTGWVLLPLVVFLAGYFGLKDYVFPRLTFDIGRSADRIKIAGYWRNILLTGIVIGIVVKIAIDRLLK